MKSDLTFKQSFSSSSAILSSLTGEVRRWLLNQFPENYFKYIRITSGIPSVDDVEGDADRMRAYRKNNPALAIRPRMKFQDDIMGSALANPNPFRYEDIGPDSHFYTLYRNDEFLQVITFLIQYWKAEFTIGIRTESEVQLVDLVGYLNERIFPENFFYINDSPILVEIPATILFRAAEDLGLNLFKKNDVIAFLDILQHNTTMPIDIKIKRDSGKKIVAFIMPVNILCKIEKLPEPEGNRKGRSEDDSKIQFTMSAQVPFPKMFKVKTEAPAERPADFNDQTGEAVISSPFETDYIGKGQFIINYALITEPPQFIKGTLAKRVFMKKFITSQEEAVDSLEMCGLLPPAIEAFIDDMLRQSRIDILKEALLFRLYKDEESVSLSDFAFDFKTKSLRLYSPLRNYIYRVVLYMETTVLQKYEAILQGIPDLKQVFDADILQ